ncbi:MAG TPA: four helix bundle protein [Dehalococcoidia bacterium]|jgi:four helix bundle protein
MVTDQRKQAIRSFRDLEVYQRAMNLLLPVYEAVAKFPDFEKYDLASQLRRACKSVPANIAEGYAKRRSAREFRAYLANAMGSATEMEVHLEIANRLGYIGDDVCAHLIEEYQILARQLYRLIEKWRTLDLRPPISDLRPPGSA